MDDSGKTPEKKVEADTIGDIKSNQKMSAKEFWIRFCFWAVIAAGIPVGFLAWRYGLFTASQGQVTSLTGWGTLASIILAIFFIYILREAKRGMPAGSMVVQCINGYTAIIPLLALLLIVHSIKNSVNYFEETLCVIILCEAIAVPINPMPKWAAQNHIDMESNIIISAIRKAIGKDKQ